MWGIALVSLAGAALIAGMGLLSVRADRQSKKKTEQASVVVPPKRTVPNGINSINANAASDLQNQEAMSAQNANAAVGVGQ